METTPTFDNSNTADTTSLVGRIPSLIQHMEKVIKGKRKQLEMVVTCLLAKGHILMEDNPGTGKTVLARTLAHAISGHQNNQGVIFKRIQFTPDLLPMDLIGSHIFDDNTKDFIFKKGPLFTNILLADEINRASPKVQSALLEAMAEEQITAGDITYKLENMFFAIATQNPIEMEGTYPLPTAQLDRFFMKIYFGYVDEDTEIDIYKNYNKIQSQLHNLEQSLSLNEVLRLQNECENIFVHDQIIQTVANIVRQTRSHPEISLGASTRGGIAFIRCLKAYALVCERDYVIEDDVMTLAETVLKHRLIFRSKDAEQKVLEQIVHKETERLSKLKIY